MNIGDLLAARSLARSPLFTFGHELCGIGHLMCVEARAGIEPACKDLQSSA